MSTITPSVAVDRNITLAFDFVSIVLDDPAILDTVPEGATLVFLPDDDPAMVESNVQLGSEIARNGANVYFMHVTSVAAPGNVRS